VRDAEHLVLARELPELLADHVPHATADALVQLVEDQDRRLVDGRQCALQRQHEAGELSAARDLRKRPRRLPQIGGHEELDAVDAGLVEGYASALSLDLHSLGIRSASQVHREARARHAERLHLLLDDPCQRPSSVSA
jgi:hypothetical protein